MNTDLDEAIESYHRAALRVRNERDRLAEENKTLREVRDLFAKGPEALEAAVVTRIREEWQNEFLLLQESWEIDPDISAGEILDRLDAALDRICPKEHVTPPAQEGEGPVGTFPPAARE